MDKRFLFYLFILLVGCNKPNQKNPDDTKGENVSVLVAPNLTDANYASTDQQHYVIRNTKTHLNKLLVFIGGSYSDPKGYYLFCTHAAGIGLDVISLSYPNNNATAPLGVIADPLIFDNYREELCFGNQVSYVVSVDNLNSISTRILKLLIYLKSKYPDQNWGQYLSSGNTLIWSKIVVAGHSQGSGHACYLGKKKLVDRVVMFAGPNDFSTNFNAPANWLVQVGHTPLSKHYSLLHTQDEIVPFEHQVANIKGLGLLQNNESPRLVDNLVSPFGNAHSLSLNIPAISNHSSPIGANSKLPGVWTYMLTAQ